MDMTQSIEPRSDQINADDLLAGPITYTVREVIKGAAEHPFDFLLVETDRAYRPSKTMRRVIVNAWGAEAANYAARRLTLYREPSIKFGGQEVGGIRISHMSHISGPVEVMAQTTRGKREKFTVQPLIDPMDDVPFVPENAAPAAPPAESPQPSPGPVAAHEPATPGAGGGLIETLDDAKHFLRPMKGEQIGVLKRMLNITEPTTKPDLALVLLSRRSGEHAQDILAEMAGW